MLKADEIKQTIAFQCRNCGECCGPVPFNREDTIRIYEYLSTLDKNDIERWRAQKVPLLICQFRDMDNRKCFIHPVRPEICKMQGHYEGLPCPYQPQFATKNREEGRRRLEQCQ